MAALIVIKQENRNSSKSQKEDRSNCKFICAGTVQATKRPLGWAVRWQKVADFEACYHRKT